MNSDKGDDNGDDDDDDNDDDDEDDADDGDDSEDSDGSSNTRMTTPFRSKVKGVKLLPHEARLVEQGDLQDGAQEHHRMMGPQDEDLQDGPCAPAPVLILLLHLIASSHRISSHHLVASHRIISSHLIASSHRISSHHLVASHRNISSHLIASHISSLDLFREDVTHEKASSVWLSAPSCQPTDDETTVVYRPMGDQECGYLLEHGQLPDTQPYQTIVEGEAGRHYAEKYLRGQKKVDSSPTTVVEFVTSRTLVDRLFQMQHKPEDGVLSHGLGNKGGHGLPFFNASLHSGETTFRLVLVKRPPIKMKPK